VSMVGWALVGLSSIAMFVFGIQILITAFKTSIGWGLASPLIPFAVLVFVIKHWEQTKKPFLRTLACLPVYAIGFALAMYGAMSSMPTQ